MKKAVFLPVLVLFFAMLFSQTVNANMAAPEPADIGSSITFEKNDSISVLSEVLDITVHGSKADIVATYQMRNASDEKISVKSMFLSPNIEDSGVRVTAGGRELSFTAESYVLEYDTEIETNDWKYAVLSEKAESPDDGRTVDCITFGMDFAPHEEYDVVVSYTYRLGGYPEYDTNVKEGEIEYYLAPAAMWKDFGGLTINLYLDKDMPVISRSNLEFEKTGARTYRYVSDTLPEENLKITIDENWFQNMISTLRNPYGILMLLVFSPFILIFVAIIVLLVWFFHRRRKAKRQRNGN